MAILRSKFLAAKNFFRMQGINSFQENLKFKKVRFKLSKPFKKSQFRKDIEKVVIKYKYKKTIIIILNNSNIEFNTISYISTLIIILIIM